MHRLVYLLGVLCCLLVLEQEFWERFVDVFGEEQRTAENAPQRTSLYFVETVSEFEESGVKL